MEGNAATLTEAIKEHAADVALLRAPVEHPSEVRFQRLLQEPMLAAIARSHPGRPGHAKDSNPAMGRFIAGARELSRNGVGS